MNKIKLSSFKAFEDELVIPLDGKNLLLYGENGSGKSSIYSALKVAFYNAKLELGLSASTPEDLKQLKDELWESYNNVKGKKGFEIEIDDINYQKLDISNLQVFMISIEEIRIENNINFKELIIDFCIPINDYDTFCKDNHNKINENVNSALKEAKESVVIEIDEQQGYDVKITDDKRNIEKNSNIKSFFNEAKLNLIILLILLNTIECIKEESKSKILVLDDFITSLDSANRTFLIRYILTQHSNTQIIIFTHNISFYNLIMHIVNNYYNETANWKYSNLYEIENKHKLFFKLSSEKVDKIKEDYSAISTSISKEDIENIGNRIRKKFEVLLYEHSKLLMIGAVEESNEIFNRISKKKPIFFHQGRTASDLIDSIEKLLENDGERLVEMLKSKIAQYKIEDYDNFRNVVNELKLYQKVTMHPMSHGIPGMATFTKKEIEASLMLLGKMEAYLYRIANKDVTSS